MPSIEEFLQTGQVGDLAVGMTKDFVLQRFGNPETTSIRMRPEICKYGPFELAFWLDRTESEPRLESISLRVGDPKTLQHPILRLTDWPLGQLENVGDFLSHLEKICLGVERDRESGPDRHLVLQSGVKVTFHQGRLRNISYSDPTESKIQQMSILILEDDLDIIRRTAKARGLSASALCSLWVKEQVSILNLQKV